MNPYVARICRKSGFKHVVTDVNGKYAIVKIPFPTTRDLNRVGGIGILQLMSWLIDMELSTEDPETHDTLFNVNQLCADQYTFLGSLSIAVEKEFYNILEGEKRPSLAVKHYLGYVGSSSYSFENYLFDEISGKFLARYVQQLIHVDKATRKPAPLLVDWKEKFGPLALNNKRLVAPVLEVPGENVHKFTLRASWNDMDEFQHVNYRSYVVFCLEAAMEAVQDRFYVGFYDDILFYNVKSIRMNFLNEARPGEYLTVGSWQDRQNPKTLHFSIDREGTVLFQSSMEFFPRFNL